MANKKIELQFFLEIENLGIKLIGSLELGSKETLKYYLALKNYAGVDYFIRFYSKGEKEHGLALIDLNTRVEEYEEKGKRGLRYFSKVFWLFTDEQWKNGEAKN